MAASAAVTTTLTVGVLVFDCDFRHPAVLARELATIDVISPLTLIGSAGDIAERLHARRERWGYSYHVIPGDKARDLAPTVAALAGS